MDQLLDFNVRRYLGNSIPRIRKRFMMGKSREFPYTCALADTLFQRPKVSKKRDLEPSQELSKTIEINKSIVTIETFNRTVGVVVDGRD